ncbi:hypothetical protein ACLOJK_005732 [Asimina triloba]
MEHLWCSITYKRWVAAMAATTAAGEEHDVATGGTHARPPSPSRRCRAAACEPPPTSPPPCTVDVVEEGKLATVRTHHRRAIVAPIRAIHHDGDDARIPDLLRSQADADHSGHTSRVFLARHQQIQLHPAPIVAHFRSNPSHLSIHIFMDHSTDFDPRMDQREGNTDRFLLRLHPAIHFSKSLLPFSRHQRGLDQWIQAVHCSVHRRPPLPPPSDAPTADVAARARLRLPTSLPAPATASARCPLPAPVAASSPPSACCPRPPTTAQIKRQQSSIQQATCM